MLMHRLTEEEFQKVDYQDYEIVDRLDETPHSTVYRAQRKGSLETVVVKVLKAINPTPFEIARFKYEFELIKDNHVDGVVNVLDIIEHEQGMALVMEDFYGLPLSSFLTTGLGLETLLNIFTRLSEILGHIHEKNILHKDIKPQNILYNKDQDILKIGDFGISLEFTGITNEVYNPKVIEGTLAYMSPEQTGRMNCPVDYRTDLYSLGISFYEMLTGRVPFISSDPMELIHAHIAKVPLYPHILNPSVPKAVSDIVMKLLSKSPDERYQNSFGVMEDLSECRRRLKAEGNIQPFPLGRHDVSRAFTLPQILVGRKKQIGILEVSLDRVVKGAVEVLLVAGEPGVGKSSLVNEMNRLIVDKKGYYIAGKYNQYQKQIPYSSIIQAFQALTPQLLSESEDNLREWKQKLMKALGANGKIITDAIPEVELIIGKQPDLPELGPEETENRFNLVLKNFIKTFAAGEHPLVMFLDDLQWTDRASLNLIQSVVTDQELSHFFLIGAYRDNETPEHHPLMLVADEIKAKGVWLNSMTLDVLSDPDVTRFLASFLKCGEEDVAQLAKIIHAKTLGNPFFINQFVKTLYDQHYLKLDAQKGWVWDADDIASMQVTDNVVDLMTEKIVRLSDTALTTIKVCSCIGDTFDIELVSGVMGLSYADAFRTVDELIRTSLINTHKKMYRFQHDRIQEAAYSLIPGEEREAIHLKVGQRLLQLTPPDEIPSRCFAIVDQFNQAKTLITSDEQRYKIAQLNLSAGVKAKESTAYEAASSYLKSGMDLLPESSWKDKYTLTYDLYKERMEAEHLGRNFEESERLFAEINRKARDRKDRARVYYTMILLYTTIGKINEALDLGIEGVKMFGIKLSKDCGKLPVIMEIIRIKKNLKKVPIEDILNYFVCTDEDTIAKCELYGAVGLPAYYANPNLFAHTILKGINGDFVHGLVHTSAFGFIAIATILCMELGDFDTAYRLGEMALKLNEKMDDKRHAAKVHFVFGYMIMHWSRPLKDCLEYFDKAYRIGLETGDFLYCGNAINVSFGIRLLMGENIDRILEEHGRYRDFQDNVKDPFVATQFHLYAKYCLYLKGVTRTLSVDEEGNDNYDAIVDEARKQGNMLGVFILLLRKQQAAFQYGHFDIAYETGFELDSLLEYPKGSYFLVEHLFYRSMSLLAVYAEKQPKEQRKIMKIVSSHKKKLKKWLVSASENITQKYTLICAEEAAVTKKPLEAADLYRKAIRLARDQGYINMEAIANERAAMFYLSKSYDEIARVYLEAAHKCYEKWGAQGKTRDLEESFPFLKAVEISHRSNRDSGFTTTATGTAFNSTLLDLTTVMKVSQTISSEIMIDRLLESIMTMAVMNAGAQKGFLILDKDGNLTIEAARTEDGRDMSVTPPMPLDICNELSSAIVHYVQRRKESVILGNAAAEGEFKNDPYVLSKKCKSVLAMPILKKGNVFGILYMENNLIPNAFTSERLELLKIIATQAAISIENARLFEQATTDGLTKLFAHRYFQLMADQEVERYKRYKHPFSLIMMDIDNFKIVNDTYGHPVGDQVLINVAKVIKKSCRVVDCPARYGGEEFAVILPETDLDGARIVAEKIRAGVEAIQTSHGPAQIATTLSLGVATFPFHAKTKEDLIRSADNSLYTSKRKGKNRVTVGEIKV